MRWHQGRITSINTDNGVTTYNGVHTKGQADGKFVTYKGYSYDFQQFPLHKLRVGPNVFDLLYDEENSEDDYEENYDTDNVDAIDVDNVDVYFSYFGFSGFEDSLHPTSVAQELKTKGIQSLYIIIREKVSHCDNESLPMDSSTRYIVSP